MRVNIGAGDKPRRGWINVDLDDFDATGPWPYETSSLDQVNADCVLPHIPPPAPGERDGLESFMHEAARCLRTGGLLTVSAPDWRLPCEALGDVYHYRLITPRTFYHFHTPATERPLEASGNWFHRPKWRALQLEDDASGVARIFPNGMPCGKYQEPLVKILARRLGLRFLLRHTHVVWMMVRNAVQVQDHGSGGP